MIEQFRFLQGGFAACGRRVTFPAMGKSPKDRRGTAQNERFALIFAHPTPSGPSGHLPLTGGVGPGPHFTGGRQLGDLGSQRKGAGGSADWLTFYDRCR